MKLGKHAPSLGKCIKMVRNYNDISHKIKLATTEKQVEYLQGRLDHTGYAVAREVCLKHGYSWTVNYGDK